MKVWHAGKLYCSPSSQQHLVYLMAQDMQALWYSYFDCETHTIHAHLNPHHQLPAMHGS